MRNCLKKNNCNICVEAISSVYTNINQTMIDIDCPIKIIIDGNLLCKMSATEN
jgi:hypothetical protein